MILENNILYPSNNKIFIRKKDGLVRISPFKLGRNETQDDYFEGIAYNVRGELIGIEEQNTYDETITALIRTRYTLDKELAMINNYNTDHIMTDEYEQFLQFRSDCKTSVKNNIYA